MNFFNFPKGTYVVLLRTANGDSNLWEDSLPVEYVYKLKQGATPFSFYPELDIRNNKDNGWRQGVGNTKLYVDMREATAEEAEAYRKAKKPFPVAALYTPEQVIGCKFVNSAGRVYEIVPSTRGKDFATKLGGRVYEGDYTMGKLALFLYKGIWKWKTLPCAIPKINEAYEIF